jgi:stage III sporulation protein SpoIIIAA
MAAGGWQGAAKGMCNGVRIILRWKSKLKNKGKFKTFKNIKSIKITVARQIFNNITIIRVGSENEERTQSDCV